MKPTLFDTSPQSVGLKRGDYTKLAKVCKVSVTHVRAVALGHRKGSASLCRKLTKRGWASPDLRNGQ